LQFRYAIIFLGIIIALALTATINPTHTIPTSQSAAAQALPNPPAGLKNYFMVGLANSPGDFNWMTSSGVPWDARYQYLSAGVNTGSGWATWNSPAGQFASYYMSDSAANGYTPIFTYYQLIQSAPNYEDYSNLNNASTMKAYYADFKLLLDKIKAFGKTTIVHVEPDLWGFLQQRNSNPNNITASVASSGYGDVVASQPNTVSGFAKALVALRDKYAPNALLAWHISPWASTYGDLSSDKSSTFNVAGAAQQTANFYLQTGANFDLMFYDIADRDAALYQSWGDPNRWWDTTNSTYPNFNRFNQFALAITTATGKRGMLWQVPIGNTLYKSMNNTTHHWQDNKAQYYLNDTSYQHVQDLANSGIIGILFGAGDGNSTSYDDGAGDGVTNPAAINGNNLTATYSDDDGGNLRTQAKAYYSHGALTLPSAGTAPSPTATPTKAPTATPTKAPTATPTKAPTATPTKAPTATPTKAPTATPTRAATATPTKAPTATPTKAPTATPAAPSNWVLTTTTSGTLTSGSTVTFTSKFTAPAKTSGSYILDVEVYNLANNAKVGQWAPTKTLNAGQTVTLTNTLKLSAGTYVIKQGVFTTKWSLAAWQDGATFTVK